MSEAKREDLPAPEKKKRDDLPAPGDFSWMKNGKKSFWDRVKEDPLVPLGCMATTGVLVGGLAAFGQGRSKLSNIFMQLRVVAQAGTIVALAGGGYLASKQKQEKKNQSYEERLDIKVRDL